MTMDDEMDRDLERTRPSGELAGGRAVATYRDSDEPAVQQRRPEEGERAPEPGGDPMPAQEEPMPAQEEPIPAQEEPMPTQEEPIPAQEEPMPTQQERMPAQAEPMPAQAGPMPAQAEPVPAQASRRTPGPVPDGSDILGSGELTAIRDRWEGLQAMFVDDPAGAARQADTLVGDVLDHLQRRHRALHDETARGTDGEADTEALRVEFLRYRSFFRSLLG